MQHNSSKYGSHYVGEDDHRDSCLNTNAVIAYNNDSNPLYSAEIPNNIELDAEELYNTAERLELNGDIRSANHYLLSAEKGYLPAIKKIAKYYDDCQDYHSAHDWYEKAANQNDIDSLLRLGWICRIVPEFHYQAYNCYRRASRLGNNYATAELGQMEMFKAYCTRDLIKAEAHLKEAANNKEPIAYLYLVQLYTTPDYHNYDLSQARLWYSKAVAAGFESEDYENMILRAVPFDELIDLDEKELKRYKKAGNGNAFYISGHRYLYGETVDKNYKKAEKNLVQALENGSIKPKREICMLLAYLYLQDDYLHKSEARQYILNAKKLGEDTAEIETILYDKHSVEDFKSFDIQSLQDLIKQSNAKAMIALATLYEDNVYISGTTVKPEISHTKVEKKLRKAIDLYRKALKLGYTQIKDNSYTISHIGDLYLFLISATDSYQNFSKSQLNSYFLLNEATDYFSNYVKLTKDYNAFATYFKLSAIKAYCNKSENAQLYENAIAILKEAALHGDANIQVFLADIYKDGYKFNKHTIIKQNNETSLNFYSMLVANPNATTKMKHKAKALIAKLNESNNTIISKVFGWFSH